MMITMTPTITITTIITYLFLSLLCIVATNAFPRQLVPSSIHHVVGATSSTRLCLSLTNDSLLYLQSLGAITSRGEFASPQQKDSALPVIHELERSYRQRSEGWPSELHNVTGTVVPTTGRWELVYSSTQLFRSSPFFMAGRAVCTTREQADRYNWFCDVHRQALAISTIKAVRQIVSNDRLVSEFEVMAGAVPFLRDFTPWAYSGGLPVAVEGSIVSSAELTWTDTGDMELLMDTVQIKGSNVPGLRQILDGGFMRLQTRTLGDFLRDNVAGYGKPPRPVFRTTYLDDKFRISRDQDDHIFVYVKTSDSTEPTDYTTNVEADLGLLKLLEGFNDAVTKVYL